MSGLLAYERSIVDSIASFHRKKTILSGDKFLTLDYTPANPTCIDETFFATYRLLAKIKAAKLKAQDPHLGDDSCYIVSSVSSCDNSPYKSDVPLYLMMIHFFV